MGSPSRPAKPAVIDRLQREPYRFEFFQAVRILERLRPESAPVGRDYDPAREVARFGATPALSFQAGEVSQVQDRGSGAPHELDVAFFGLFGPSGVLPDHYSSLLMQRSRDKDTSLRDFLDLFNHRLVSFFFRAWEKSRLSPSYERARLDGKEDLFTEMLEALVGLGTGKLRGQLQVDDRVLLHYGGHFSQQRPMAASLEAMLSEQFRMPVEVVQFHGQWLSLAQGDRSRLASRTQPGGQFCQLGRDAMLGERRWDVESRFLLRLGPLSYKQFCRLTPNGDSLRPLCEMTRMYVGPQFDFDVQPLLQRSEVPPCQLSRQRQDGPCLGWNMWLPARDRQGEPLEVRDANFPSPV